MCQFLLTWMINNNIYHSGMMIKVPGLKSSLLLAYILICPSSILAIYHQVSHCVRNSCTTCLGRLQNFFEPSLLDVAGIRSNKADALISGLGKCFDPGDVLCNQQITDHHGNINSSMLLFATGRTATSKSKDILSYLNINQRYLNTFYKDQIRI